MCFHSQLNFKPKKIEKAFQATFLEPELFSPQESINGFTYSKTPVITDENRENIQLFNWGLIPFWAKDDSIKKLTLNAKIETAATKPAFRNSVENRCLIIASGYYEWQWQDPKGKQKQKFLIKDTEQELFAFAGIYSSWQNPETNFQVNSYSILTTDANELMQKIHNNKMRMPVILHKNDHTKWLEGQSLEYFSFPYTVNLKAKACK